MSKVRLKHIEIDGNVSVERWDGHVPEKGYAWVYIVVGPTGSGKSSFIEALAGPDARLGISKNQLESFTHEITIYKLINATRYTYPIMIVDCPGFADPHRSEKEIMDDILKGEQEINFTGFNLFYILYVMPITDTRVARSKSSLISMFKGLGRGEKKLISVVTTMWDTLCNEGMRCRAESSFDQLKANAWKDSNCINRFYNTQASALQILDSTMQLVEPLPHIELDHLDKIPTLLLYKNLLDRISSCTQQVTVCDFELRQPDTRANNELKNIVLKRRRDANQLRIKFCRQLVDFGPPPSGCDDVVVPWGLLLPKQMAKQAFRIGKRSVVGKRTNSLPIT